MHATLNASVSTRETANDSLHVVIGDEEAIVVSDAELIRRFVELHDRNSLSSLVERHSQLVWGVARRYLRRQERAEDVFQATFLILAEKAARIRHRDSLASWLHSVARRLSLRAPAEKRIVSTHRLPQEPAVNDPELDAVGEALDQQQIDDALQSLASTIREPLVLYYLEGLNVREVSARLNLTPDTVEGRLKRGREQLRRKLRKQGITLSALAAVLCSEDTASAGLTPDLLHATTSAAFAWSEQFPLTGCTPQAAHLAGKELAAMTPSRLLLTLTTTVACCFGVGLSVAWAQLGGGFSPIPPSKNRIGGEGFKTNVSAPSEQADTAQQSHDVDIVPSAEVAAPSDSSSSTQKVPAVETRDYLSPSEKGMKIEKALEGPISLDFVESPISDVIVYLTDVLGVPVLVDHPALAEVGVSLDQPVTLTLSEHPASQALNLLFEEYVPELDVIIKNDVLLITSRNKADEHQEIVLYELRPLTPLNPLDIQVILEQMTEVNWMNRDGVGGSSVAMPGAIIVRQTQRGHRQVRQILSQVEKFVQRPDLEQAAPLPEQTGSVPLIGPGGGGFGGGGFGGGGFGGDFSSDGFEGGDLGGDTF